MKKALNMEIGSRIRKCREALGYSRETLAEKSDLATSFISTIELGSGSFSAESLIKLCKALGTSADYILFGEKTNSDLSAIYGILSGLDPQYIPFVEQMLSAYVRSLTLTKS